MKKNKPFFEEMGHKVNSNNHFMGDWIQKPGFCFGELWHNQNRNVSYPWPVDCSTFLKVAVEEEKNC